MRTATAAIRVTIGFSGSKSKNRIMMKNNTAPKINPIIWAVLLVGSDFSSCMTNPPFFGSRLRPYQTLSAIKGPGKK
jgi:hypothetical protein